MKTGLLLALALTLPAAAQEGELAQRVPSVDSWYFSAALPDPGPVMPVIARGHSHNDYRHDRALYDALDEGFYSVEADVWLANGELMVGHLPFLFKGTLEELYLDPLQAIIDERGSVRGDGMPFYLWIDIKDWRPELAPMIKAMLDRYPMLTTFSDQGRVPAPVVAILSGKDGPKKAIVEGYELRRCIRDSNDWSEADPDADYRWSWYALDYTEYLKWDGEEPMPAAERAKLRKLVDGAHAKGRRIRFWEVPEKEAIWQELFNAGADQISADDLPRFKAFLDEQQRLQDAR